MSVKIANTREPSCDSEQLYVLVVDVRFFLRNVSSAKLPLVVPHAGKL